MLHKLSISITTATALLLLACGSSGSSSSGLLVSGQLTDTEAQPLVGYEVTVDETGVTTTTDFQGNYELQSEISGTQFTLFVRGAEDSATTTITGLPEDTVEVTVNLEFDEHNDTLNATDIVPREHAAESSESSLSSDSSASSESSQDSSAEQSSSSSSSEAETGSSSSTSASA